MRAKQKKKAGRTAKDKRPDRAAGLFDQLFRLGRPATFARLSEGIGAILDNAGMLLEEATLLADAKRYDRAEFLIATAEEEMGKAYILVDMCRVDFAREDVLRRLCRAFYSHVPKSVYFDLSAHEYAGIWELAQLRDAFRVGAREWWPGSIGDGEPDMPHDTYFLREASLYVDFDGYGQVWSVPHRPVKAMLFETPFLTPLVDARKAHKALAVTRERGLLRADALNLFNRAMRGLRVNARTTEELSLAYGNAA